MGFGPGSFGGSGKADHPGQIDYRLVRQRTIDEFKRGRLSRLDICDAQPELLRAARNVGRERAQPCPICDAPGLVMVTFVFGAKLPAHGRCITTQKEMQAMARRLDEVACYVVEVCPECSWNHLLRTFPLGGRGRLSHERRVGLATETLIELSAPTTSHRDVRVAVSMAAAAGAAMMAVTSTGDVVLLGMLLGLAAYDVVAGGVGVLAGISVVARWGTSSLASLAGAQAVVGAAGWTGSAAAVASSCGAAAALVVVCPRGLAPAAAFGAVAAQLVAGPALAEGSGAGPIALRIGAPIAGMVTALVCARILPRTVARAAALVLAGAATVLAFAS